VRLLALLVAVSLLPANVLPQQLTPTPVRSVQAVSLLSQAVGTSGGLQTLAGIQDFVASGNITYFWADEPVVGNVTLRARGIGQFKLESTTPQGQLSWVTDGGAGSIRNLDRSVTTLSYQNAINLGSLTLPSLALVAALRDSTTAVSDLGLADVNGAKLEQIRVQRKANAAIDPNNMLSKMSTRDYFLDPATAQVVFIRDSMAAPYDSSELYTHEVSFSDYRNSDGLLLPYSITEQIGGQRTWTIQLTSIAFNQGLSDADFQL
jgi:hypothetical protein